jgi:hypothetical protein
MVGEKLSEYKGFTGIKLYEPNFEEILNDVPLMKRSKSVFLIPSLKRFVSSIKFSEFNVDLMRLKYGFKFDIKDGDVVNSVVHTLGLILREGISLPDSLFVIDVNRGIIQTVDGRVKLFVTGGASVPTKVAKNIISLMVMVSLRFISIEAALPIIKEILNKLSQLINSRASPDKYVEYNVDYAVAENKFFQLIVTLGNKSLFGKSFYSIEGGKPSKK